MVSRFRQICSKKIKLEERKKVVLHRGVDFNSNRFQNFLVIFVRTKMIEGQSLYKFSKCKDISKPLSLCLRPAAKRGFVRLNFFFRSRHALPSVMIIYWEKRGRGRQAMRVFISFLRNIMVIYGPILHSGLKENLV